MTGLSPRERATVASLRAHAALDGGDADAGLALATEARDRLRALGYHAEARNAASDIAHALLLMERYAEALAVLDDTLAEARAAGDHDQYRRDLGNRGMCLERLDRLDEAESSYEEALAGHRAAGDERLQSVVLGNLATLLGRRGRLEPAYAAIEEALTLSSAVRPTSLGRLQLALADLHQVAGRMDEALDALRAALSLHRSAGNRRSEGIVLSTLAHVHLQTGALGEARAAADEAVAIARELGNATAEARRLALTGRIAEVAGRLAEARALFDAAVARSPDATAWVRGRLGVLEVRAGRRAEGLATAREAVSAARLPDDRWPALAALAEALAHAGESEEALAVADAIGLPWDRAAARQRVLELTAR
jgi:tetratricopeptide (TPR) repeat protein